MAAAFFRMHRLANSILGTVIAYTATCVGKLRSPFKADAQAKEERGPSAACASGFNPAVNNPE